ncbi:unnamed protein product [Rhizophagus irregularis]|nr:unnamed protein product [Rhizophagus irregularis]
MHNYLPKANFTKESHLELKLRKQVAETLIVPRVQTIGAGLNAQENVYFEASENVQLINRESNNYSESDGDAQFGIGPFHSTNL